MTTQTWSTPLAATLANAGLASATVQTLEAYYPNGDPNGFIAGLDWLVQATKTLVAPVSPAPGEEPWATLAQATAHVTTGDLWDAVQTAAAAYAPDLQSALFQALDERQTFLDAQQQNAPGGKRRHHLSSEYLRVLTDFGYTFRMNDLNDVIEVNGVPISDNLAAMIRRQMRDKGYLFVDEMQDAYIAEAWVNRYHPVRDYLDTLAWDGQPHIAHMASYFTDRDGAFGTFVRRWLIGAVARARKAEQNVMLVLAGPQGLGKSHWVKWLASVVNRDLYVEAAIHPEDKDDMIRLASKWIWEVSELGSTTRKADVEALKGFLTRHQVTARRPYGHFDMIKPTLASFVGTVNDAGGFLTDPTGNRRFLSLSMLGINWAYQEACDPHQVWAEANAAYLAGEPWQLQPDERQLAEQINATYEVDDPIEGILKKYFYVDPTHTHEWTPSTEILAVLEQNGLKGHTRAHAMALGAVMTHLGVERRKRDNQHHQKVWGYVGVWPI